MRRAMRGKLYAPVWSAARAAARRRARVRAGLRASVRDERGQATVEAAFALPVVMLLLLLLLQPGIVLYDRIVMEGAAAEGCRLLATLPADGAEEAEDFLRRRLGAVPQHDAFHIHGGGSCSWQFEITGCETSPEVSVTIRNELKPLPLVDVGASLLGLVNERGNLEVRASASAATQPPWAGGSELGLNPEAWIGAWL